MTKNKPCEWCGRTDYRKIRGKMECCGCGAPKAEEKHQTMIEAMTEAVNEVSLSVRDFQEAVGGIYICSST